MRLWPRKKDEGDPPYRPLPAEAFTKCIEAGWQIVQEGRRRWWCWNEDAFKLAFLKEAVGEEVLAGLDNDARERLLMTISKEQYGSPRTPSRAQRRRWKRLGIDVEGKGNG